MNRLTVLGTEIDSISAAGAVTQALACMDCRRGAYVVTPNTEIVLTAMRSEPLRDAIRKADLSLPDSVGVMIAARILGTPLDERIPGVDFASELLSRMSKEERSVFLLGAREGVAQRAALSLFERYPGLVITGTQNGFFGSEDECGIVDRINTLSPDLLLVCLGTPRQELWMYRNRGQINAGLMVGLGGALDVFAGDVERAPEQWRRYGLEWLFRLIHQPWRIKRDAALPLIVLAALWNRIGGTRTPWQTEN